MAELAALRELEAEDIEDIRQRLKEFVRPFQEVLVREEQRRHLAVYVEGRLMPLQRRTGEPIAMQSGVKARPLQHFVGQGKWADEAVREVMADLIAEKMGSRRGVLILDASGIQKYGDDSVGVQRQWCGRLGKEERCQVGEFLAYASQGSVALVDGRLYLPKGWAEDAQRREKCQVPPEVEFRTGWQLALQMVKGIGQRVAHAWVVGDDSYGRPCALRDGLHEAGERYVLEVPGKAKVRLVRGGGWTTAKAWADSLPAGAWQRFTLRDGEKGPLPVRAAKARVLTSREDGTQRVEVLVVVDSLTSSKCWWYLATDTQARLAELVRAASCRHGVEEALRYAKSEVGLAEYEVRGWVGWHHHMTLCLMAQWFLASEKRWLEKRGYAFPYRRYAECWPTCLYPTGTSTSWPRMPVAKRSATSQRAEATGAHTDGALLPATASATPCDEAAYPHLAQFN
jgi:SRSO17 transposase